MFVDGRLNADMVGQSAYGLGKLFGINVPKKYKVRQHTITHNFVCDLGPPTHAFTTHVNTQPHTHNTQPRNPQVLIGEIEKIGDDEPLSHVRPPAQAAWDAAWVMCCQ